METGKLNDRQEVHALPAGDSNLVFSKILSLAGDFSLILEHPFQFFHRFLLLHLLLSLRPSPSPQVVLRCLVLELMLVDAARARVLDADSLDVLSAVSSPANSDPFCAHLQ